ncbi:MAG: hypothetical protein GTN69_06945, partial [Armatimonadetes bacterium]|nr:hypothetical protein [Armatimonadota bacterium]
MTVPQLTTITPSEGLTSGRDLIVIRGVHYREADPENEIVNTVSVTFNGEPAEYVLALAHYVLHVVTPRYLGDPSDLPKAVDVVVTNLDDDGEPIPGETVTAVDGYTYKRPRIFRDSASRSSPVSMVDAVNLALIKTLKREVIKEVSLATDFDFSDDPTSGLTAVATLPAILISGPTISLARQYLSRTLVEVDRSDPEGTVAVRRPTLPLSFAWGIVVIANRKHLVSNVVNALIRFMDRRPYLRVPTTAARTGYVEREISYGNFTASDRPPDNVYTSEVTLSVAPIDLDDDFGLA